jgi:two-component system, OmpR family, response regulator
MPEPAIEIDEPAAVHPSLIALLRWPDQDAERRRLVARREPRILVISQYTAPPGLLDDLELWVLDGAQPDEILAAMDRLRRKTRSRPAQPALDQDGLLHFDGRWVAVPDTQLPVVDLLVRNIDRLVRSDDIRHAYVSAGGSGKPSSFRTVIRRIGERLAEVGLKLHVIRHRGVILARKPTTDEPSARTD